MARSTALILKRTGLVLRIVAARAQRLGQKTPDPFGSGGEIVLGAPELVERGQGIAGKAQVHGLGINRGPAFFWFAGSIY